MKRRQLADILRRVEPALASRDFVPVFTCFCFDGETVTTHDDRITMQAPCPWDIKGGINRGLLGFLRHRQTEQDVIAVVEGSHVTIKLGGRVWESKLLPTSDFPHSLPDDEGSVAIDIGDLFIDCLRKCHISLGWNPDHPWRLGVTLAFTEGRITFYSSDDSSASRAILDRQVPDELVGRSVILAPYFCPVLLKADRWDRLATIVIDDDWTKAMFESGLVLFCRTEAAADVDRYASVFDSIGADYADTVPIPSDFDDHLELVERSFIAQRGRAWWGNVWLTIQDGELQVEVAVGEQVVRGSVAIGGEHEPCRMLVPLSLLRRIRPHVSEVCIQEDGVLLLGRDFAHIIAVQKVGDVPLHPGRISGPLRVRLTDLFADGQPRPCKVVMQAVRDAGFTCSDQTVHNARKLLGIKAQRVGGRDGYWEWQPPSMIKEKPRLAG